MLLMISAQNDSRGLFPSEGPAEKAFCGSLPVLNPRMDPRPFFFRKSPGTE
jgi:hypothetical protein